MVTPFVKLGSTTLGSAATSITVSSIAAKKYLLAELYIIRNATDTPRIRIQFFS